MAVEVSQSEEIFGGGKNGREKGVGFVISRRKSNRGAQTLRKELFREMVTFT